MKNKKRASEEGNGDGCRYLQPWGENLDPHTTITTKVATTDASAEETA